MDKLVWCGKVSGGFSVHNGYKNLLQEHHSTTGNNGQNTYSPIYKRTIEAGATLKNQDYELIESTEHAFRDCPSVVEIWEKLDIRWPQEQNQMGDDTMHFILRFIHELDGLNQRLPARRVVGEQWRPPETVEGQVLHFKVFINTNIPTAFAAEALSCLQETEFGIDLGLERVMIEGDSLTANKGAHVLAQEGLQSEEVTYLQHRLPKAVEMVVDDESGHFWLQDNSNRKECCAMERNHRPLVDLNKWLGKQRYLESGLDMGKILFRGDSRKKWGYLRWSESHR
ncbi:hypothetical protein Gotri_012931 [Gossypium trilobum]|uniref:RNase H type-1 domain-containing protein n=1 Tax=Gossypium trilobum TaxID=34281 RepID=A0A7J9DRY9_9ROSI|nr:hypothetical protein [Gossypium trilobum]